MKEFSKSNLSKLSLLFFLRSWWFLFFLFSLSWCVFRWSCWFRWWCCWFFRWYVRFRCFINWLFNGCCWRWRSWCSWLCSLNWRWYWRCYFRGYWCWWGSSCSFLDFILRWYDRFSGGLSNWS